MSVDIRDRLREAASEPSSPLDTAAIYRRGRRGRRTRVAGLATAMVLGVAAATGVVMAISAPDNVPIVEPVGVQDELLADGWVSWREYRIAADAVSDCLDDRGFDPAYRFDDQTGRFTFAAAGTAAFDACSSAHLERVEAAWWDKVGPDTDGVSWQQYRTAVQASVECINSNGGDAQAVFSLDSGVYGLSLRETDEISGCRRDNWTGRLERQWADQVGPSPAEDRAFYEAVARCLRDLGHDVPDADPSTLSEALEAFPGDYDRCFDQTQQQRSQVGDVPTAAPDENDGAPPAPITDVELPEVSGDPVPLPQLDEETNSMAVAVRHGAATFVQIDDGEQSDHDIGELAPGDPPFRVVAGDRLVLYGGNTIYAMDPQPSATPEPILATGSFAVFVPAGVPDRVWVRPGRTDGSPAPIRQIDLEGNTLIGPVDSPGGNILTGLKDTVILSAPGDRLIVWDPTTNEVVQEVDGPYPMGTDGRRFAWCDADCRDLFLSTPEDGTTTKVAALPTGYAFAGYRGTMSPDGRYLAAHVCVAQPDGRCALTVIELPSGNTWTVADGWIETSQLAWSPDSRWVFTTTQDHHLIAYRPGSTQAALTGTGPLPTSYGLAAFASR